MFYNGFDPLDIINYMTHFGSFILSVWNHKFLGTTVSINTFNQIKKCSAGVRTAIKPFLTLLIQQNMKIISQSPLEVLKAQSLTIMLEG